MCRKLHVQVGDSSERDRWYRRPGANHHPPLLLLLSQEGHGGRPRDGVRFPEKQHGESSAVYRDTSSESEHLRRARTEPKCPTYIRRGGERTPSV